MMREVLERRFKRLMAEAPRQSPSFLARLASAAALASLDPPLPQEEMDILLPAGDESGIPLADLVLIDGGQGQLNAVREVLTALWCRRAAPCHRQGAGS